MTSSRIRRRRRDRRVLLSECLDYRIVDSRELTAEGVEVDDIAAGRWKKRGGGVGGAELLRANAGLNVRGTTGGFGGEEVRLHRRDFEEVEFARKGGRR